MSQLCKLQNKCDVDLFELVPAGLYVFKDSWFHGVAEQKSGAQTR